MKLGSKQKQKQLYTIRAMTAVLVLLCVWVAWSTYSRFTIEREMAARRELLETEKASLEARKAELTEKVEYLEAEASVEAEIRRNFDVAREGEQVVIILDEEEVKDQAVTPPPRADEPWYKFW